MSANKEEKQLLGLIERYYDGQTSLEQERQLRRLLAQSDSQHPAVAEARAVLGAVQYADITPAAGMQPLAGRAVDKPYHKRTWLRAASVTIGVVVAGALALLMVSRQTQELAPAATPAPADSRHPGQCYAYVGNKLISDNDAVLDIISSQLADMGRASKSVDIQLSIPRQDIKR